KSDRICVKAQQTSAGLDTSENFLRVSAVSNRAIDSNFTWFWREHFENFRNHDGPMRAGGRFAGGDDFCDGVRVTLRVVLFVFFFEATRIFAGVARAAAMGTGLGRRVAGHELNSCPFGKRMYFVLELSHRLVG